MECPSPGFFVNVAAKGLNISPSPLEPTLARVLATVGSKGLGDMLSPLAATFTKKPGEGHSIASPFLIRSICLALLVSPPAKAQQKSPPPHQVSQIEVYESSEDLHETLQEKPALTFAAARAPYLTITVDDSVK